MRVISKFQDYYDSSMRYGQDKTIVFVRKAETFRTRFLAKDIANVFRLIEIRQKEKGKIRLSFLSGAVIFCGKIYRFIKARKYISTGYMTWETDERFFYNFEDLEAFIEESEFTFKLKETFWRWATTSIKTEREVVREFFKDNGSPCLEDFCIENQYCTISCMPGDFERNAGKWSEDHIDTEIEVNGNLAKFQFYKVFDPFSAYQELDMYISGVLPQAGAMTVDIEDKYRIAQHGFDKYSFRKPKQK